MIGNGPVGGLALGIYSIFINAVVGYPVALVLGVPLYMVSRWRRWVGRTSYVCVGLVIGAGLGVLGSGQMIAGGETITAGILSDAIKLSIGGAVCGGLSTACFWLIIRPDRAPWALAPTEA